MKRQTGGYQQFSLRYGNYFTWNIKVQPTSVAWGEEFLFGKKKQFQNCETRRMLTSFFGILQKYESQSELFPVQVHHVNFTIKS